MTRKKVFWNHFALAMVHAFINRQLVLSLAIIWIFMLAGTTEEAAAAANIPRYYFYHLKSSCSSF